MVLLKSGLEVLLTMDICELLKVQEDTISLIRTKLEEQRAERQEHELVNAPDLNYQKRAMGRHSEMLENGDESLVIESSQNFDPTALNLVDPESPTDSSTQECVRTHGYHDSSQPMPSQVEESMLGTRLKRGYRSLDLNSSPLKQESVRSLPDEPKEDKQDLSKILKNEFDNDGPIKRLRAEKIENLGDSTHQTHIESQEENGELQAQQESYKDELLPSASQLPPVIYKLTDLRKFELRRQELRKILFDPVEPGTQRRVVNMNYNPITLGKWRLQDFVVNEFSMARQLHNKKKTRKYHEEKAWEQFQRGEQVDKSYLYMFDNLKDREPEPPGYWRIMWPSTQENEHDKREMARVESRIIEDRFSKAVNSSLPVEQREFRFKEELFDEVISTGCFRYEKHNLGIRNKE